MADPTPSHDNPPPLSPGDTTMIRPLVLNPPSPSSQPSIPTEEKEHWSVRLKKLPLPCGLTHEDLAAKSSPFPDPNPTSTHPTTPLSFRRSQRLFHKSKPKPEDCVLYPPYYGRPSPKEELEMIIKQRKAQLKKRKNSTPSTFKPSPLPIVHFTEEEKKEIFERLANKSDPRQRYRERKLKAYTSCSDSDDSFVPTNPLLTEINDATLAIVGWRRKNGEEKNG